MRKIKLITHSDLLELLSYDPEVGVFIWKKNRQGHTKIGDRAGTDSNGYVAIKLYGKLYGAHRLAWFYVYGYWPVNNIDHINGNRSDNRISNLRDVTQFINAQNQRKASTRNSSGLLGAHKSRNKFQSTIVANGVRYGLGFFDTADQAHAAYLLAKRNLHSGCTL